MLGTGEVPEIVERDRGEARGRGRRTRLRRTADVPQEEARSRRSADLGPRDLAPRDRSHLPLRRRHAAAADDAAALAVREDRRRLRLHLRVLHHSRRCAASIAAGRASRSCARRGRSPSAASRSCCSSRRTRPSTASTAGSAARSRGCCASSTPIDGLAVDPPALPLSHDDHRRRARRDGRVREGVPVRGPAAAARIGGRPEADAPAGQPQDLRHAARRGSASAFPASH